jgi:hypothetical protein
MAKDPTNIEYGILLIIKLKKLRSLALTNQTI